MSLRALASTSDTWVVASFAISVRNMSETSSVHFNIDMPSSLRVPVTRWPEDGMAGSVDAALLSAFTCSSSAATDSSSAVTSVSSWVTSSSSVFTSAVKVSTSRDTSCTSADTAFSSSTSEASTPGTSAMSAATSTVSVKASTPFSSSLLSTSATSTLAVSSETATSYSVAKRLRRVAGTLASQNIPSSSQLLFPIEVHVLVQASSSEAAVVFVFFLTTGLPDSSASISTCSFFFCLGSWTFSATASFFCFALAFAAACFSSASAFLSFFSSTVFFFSSACFFFSSFSFFFSSFSASFACAAFSASFGSAGVSSSGHVLFFCKLPVLLPCKMPQFAPVTDCPSAIFERSSASFGSIQGGHRHMQPPRMPYSLFKKSML
mmetsp:Transcript_978/g.3158  ORF Transcript_978/g.3158 Transcript_978/m.3158 type:complete len:378 (+) Transcript_978:397-1530(+)